MECGQPQEEDEGGQLVAVELQAAETLAGLARSSSSSSPPLASATLSQDTYCRDVLSSGNSGHGLTSSMHFLSIVQPAQVCYAPSMIKNAENIPSQLCSTVIKSRRKLTEAEKEERKVRRILANRESARQTIRRRQAMYLELGQKSTQVFQENEDLKKQKVVAMEEYNSLKAKNELLKAQLALVKKAEKGETEEVKTDKSCSVSTTTPIFLPPNQPPPIVPCFWPPIFPSSHVFPFQCPHSTSSSQFPHPHRGQEHSIGNTAPGTAPLFVVPVPWLHPLLTHSHSIHSHTHRTNPHQCTKCSCPLPRPHEDNNQKAEPSNPKKTMSTLQLDITSHVNDTSTPESSVQMRNQEPVICARKKPEDAIVARRRRKQLMKLKNVVS